MRMPLSWTRDTQSAVRECQCRSSPILEVWDCAGCAPGPTGPGATSSLSHSSFPRPVPQPVFMPASLPPNSCLNALHGGGHGLLGKSNSLSGAAIHGIIPWSSPTSGTFLQGQLLFSKVETCLNSKSDGLEVLWLVSSGARMWGPELVCIDLWAHYGCFSSFSSHPWGQVFLSLKVVQCPTYPRYSATIS